MSASNRRSSRLLTVLLASLVLVGAANFAQAASGGSFLLGEKNASKDSTTLTNKGEGPTLTLRGTGAPLKVQSKEKVKRFNADRVDGLQGSDLATRAKVFTATEGEESLLYSHYWQMELEPGDYQVSYSAMVLVPGTVDAEAELQRYNVACAVLDDGAPYGAQSNSGQQVFDDVSPNFLSGADVMTVDPESNLQFVCSSEEFGPISVPNVRVSAVPLTSVKTADLGLSDPCGRSALRGRAC